MAAKQYMTKREIMKMQNKTHKRVRLNRYSNPALGNDTLFQKYSLFVSDMFTFHSVFVPILFSTCSILVQD
jgi:hypothetical protein